MARTILSCLGLGLATVAATGDVAGLAGHTSPEAVAAAAALGGMAGNFATDLCKVLHRPVAARWLEGRSGIDENHPVASALRLAQLMGLGAVLDCFDTVWPSDWEDSRRREAERFSHALKQFLDTETNATKRADFDATSALAVDERHIRDDVLTKLPEVFDESLAARRAGGDNAALTESLAQLRATTEMAVLTEIRLRTATLNLPAAFVRAFEGTGFPDSWFDLFAHNAAFRLEEAGFERIWNAEQLALVKAITDAHTAILAEINDRTKRIEQSQTEHTAMLQELLTVFRDVPALSRTAELSKSPDELWNQEALSLSLRERLAIRVKGRVMCAHSFLVKASKACNKKTFVEEVIFNKHKESDEDTMTGTLTVGLILKNVINNYWYDDDWISTILDIKDHLSVRPGSFRVF